MPDTPKYDSDHVILPVIHAGSNQLHNIDVPSDIPLADLHPSLVNAGYALGGNEQPTEEDAVENSEDFKQHARQAWEKIQGGLGRNKESAFWTGATGKSVEVPGSETSLSDTGFEHIPNIPSSLGSTHTHPNNLQADPSSADISAARKIHKTIWVVSRRGLYAIDPGGDVHHLYTNLDWMNKKKNK